MNSTSQEDFYHRNFKKVPAYLNTNQGIEEEEDGRYGQPLISSKNQTGGRKPGGPFYNPPEEEIDFNRDRLFREKKGVDIKADLSPWRKQFYPIYKEYDS